MPRVSLRAERHGRFFTVDPAKQVRRNIREAMEELARYGEGEIKRRIGAIPPRGVQTGATREAYTGRAQALSGKKWEVTAVVSPVYRGAVGRKRLAITGTRSGKIRLRVLTEQASGSIALMAAASAIEKKHHIVRSVAKAMGGKFRADLTKGLD